MEIDCRIIQNQITKIDMLITFEFNGLIGWIILVDI